MAVNVLAMLSTLIRLVAVMPGSGPTLGVAPVTEPAATEAPAFHEYTVSPSGRYLLALGAVTATRFPAGSRTASEYSGQPLIDCAATLAATLRAKISGWKT